jgi:hypothetical protein
MADSLCLSVNKFQIFRRDWFETRLNPRLQWNWCHTEDFFLFRDQKNTKLSFVYWNLNQESQECVCFFWLPSPKDKIKTQSNYRTSSRCWSVSLRKNFNFDELQIFSTGWRTEFKLTLALRDGNYSESKLTMICTILEISIGVFARFDTTKRWRDRTTSCSELAQIFHRFVSSKPRYGPRRHTLDWTLIVLPALPISFSVQTNKQSNNWIYFWFRSFCEENSPPGRKRDAYCLATVLFTKAEQKKRCHRKDSLLFSHSDVSENISREFQCILSETVNAQNCKCCSFTFWLSWQKKCWIENTILLQQPADRRSSRGVALKQITK